MSAEEELDMSMMMELIEGELEERKTSNDRRKKDGVESSSTPIEIERRTKTDRRTQTA